ncbi:hypothetical protein B0H10DRAFT_2225049 [Mycena sp. CBHHK59/15]|nr:hypothetical protein B0H10DRAFT_2225049 [Mycena sp. CBHHK59/15]
MVPPSLFHFFLLPSTFLLPVFAKLNQTAQLQGLTFNLSTPLPSSTIQPLSSVPASCAKYTGAGQECPTTMNAVNVTYADCSSPWTLCRCASANITLDASVAFLAHVPGEIHFFGICSQRTWIHESTHAVDGALGITQSGAADTLWAQAAGNDTCVPDTYAQSNLVEDLAQMSVVEVYRLLNNELPPGMSADCMSHQLAYLSSLPLYDANTLLGDTCAFEPQLASAYHTAAPLASNSTSQSSARTSSGASSVATTSQPSAQASESAKPNGAVFAVQPSLGLLVVMLFCLAVV